MFFNVQCSIIIYQQVILFNIIINKMINYFTTKTLLHTKVKH